MENMCIGLKPADPPAVPPCPGRYPCPTQSSPPETVCTGMKYVLAPQYVKHGFVARGATGAYVPAVTVCQSGLRTVPLNRLRQNPTATVEIVSPVG